MNPSTDTNAIGWHMCLKALGIVYAVLAIGKAIYEVCK